MSGSTTGRGALIYNEQTKLLANALDRASTALGVGSVFPLITLARPAASGSDASIIGLFSAAFLVLASWSVVLHLAARRVLRGLR